MSNFDDIIGDLGTGRWTYSIFFWTALSNLRMPASVMSGAFVAPPTEFWCLPNATQHPANTTQGECSHLGQACDQFRYDDAIFARTLTSEFGLVCSRASLRSLYSSLYMFGIMVGYLLGGFIADRYGRKAWVSFGVPVLTASVLPLVMSLSPSLSLVMVCRFLQGICHPAMYLSLYTILMEVSESRHRGALGILSGFPWALGIVGWAGMGYLIRDWRWLNGVAGLLNLLLIPSIWLVPESPRWLAVQGRFEEAAEILKKAAKLNNTKLMEDERLYQIMQDIQKDSAKSNVESNDKNQISIIISELGLLVSTGGLLRRTLSLWGIFTVVSMVYYGLSLSGVKFSDDPYVFMALSGLVELPAYTLNAPLVAKFGRRLPSAGCFFVCAAALAILPLLSKGALLMCLALLGKMTITMAFESMYLYMLELFPTEARTWGVGSTEFVAKIGAIITPYIVDNLGLHIPWLPTVIFAGSSLGAGALAFLMPDTSKLPMPDTVTETIKIHKDT